MHYKRLLNDSTLENLQTYKKKNNVKSRELWAAAFFQLKLDWGERSNHKSAFTKWNEIGALILVNFLTERSFGYFVKLLSYLNANKCIYKWALITAKISDKDKILEIRLFIEV